MSLDNLQANESQNKLLKTKNVFEWKHNFPIIFEQKSLPIVNFYCKYSQGMLIDVGICPVSFNSLGSRTSTSSFSGWFGKSFTSSYDAITTLTMTEYELIN